MPHYRTLFPALTLLLLFAILSIAKGTITHVNRDIRARRSVAPRQQNTNRLPIVASQCSEFCDPVNALVLTGCPGSSCCTDGFVNNFNNCAICIQEDAGSSDFSGAQAFFNHWSGLCDARGRPTKPVTIGRPDQPDPPANTSPPPPPPQPTSATPTPTPTPTPDRTTTTSSPSSTSTTSTLRTTSSSTESTTSASTGTRSVPDAAGPPGSGATGVSDPSSSDANGGVAGGAGASGSRAGNGGAPVLAGRNGGMGWVISSMFAAWVVL